ncbi:TPA: AraC family transcriptional regulator [Pseudomonas aeruginosa]|uniref:AraC family transcriptional regulator n=1 Tax=Pseudomonas aeruginosa TaxID=287 RepID=UPI001C6851F5|nr:AraC family transcriptional regulator [Pseudomonas aeruginosa]EKV6211134.1 AraC family transcriptional regulator [Pseudomonas aeruginosa]EKX9424825.1 AraC family transcriptional regulator [Pseudomonas aeruginosa]EMB9308964.1 AraC family transcriptional regulator [Pseudomonas aeruginosa]MBW6071169.1 AraC family transcriptional regulator [Pseudomonas aeruginosa]MCX2509972.1 AraC family transcriptional regulator [Pseudomonas aeruginosa]
MRRAVIERLCRSDCGILPTSSPSVQLFRFTNSIPRQPAMYGPSIVVIVEGEKAARLAGVDLVYNEQESLLVTGNLPLECTYRASIDKPLIGIILRVDPEDIRTYARLLTEPSNALKTAHTLTARFAHPVKTSPAMFEVIDRVLALLESELTARLFVNSAIRELLFHALSSMDSADLGAYCLDTPLTRIAAALRWIDQHPQSRPTVTQLAKQCGMSVSSLQRHFRAYTGRSPAHFIRIIRLTKARAMLETRQGSVKEIALTMGYVSVPRFSSDYRALFGHPPRETPALIFSR